MIWPFKRRAAPAVETRASGSGFTSEIIAARQSYISGARGLAELTSTASSCVSLWEAGLSAADVSGTDLLDRRTMGLLARSLALRGEFVALIGERRLVPAVDWDLSTIDGEPRAYRCPRSVAAARKRRSRPRCCTSGSARNLPFRPQARDQAPKAHHLDVQGIA